MGSSVKLESSRDELVTRLEGKIAQGEQNLDPFVQLLGVKITQANASEAVGIMEINPQVLNPYGMVHGGCLVALADSVAGHNLVAAGKLSVTLSSTVNFLSPAKGMRVICRSYVKKLGKQVSVVYTEAEDDNGKLLFTGNFTFSTIKEITPHGIG